MSLYEHEFVCIYSSSDAEPVQNFACYIVLFWRSSFEAITIITAGGNCRTLSYGLNNAGFHRDANTYDVTSRASLSMATNAMDGHSNVSSVITLSYVVVILDYTGIVWNEQKNTRFRVFETWNMKSLLFAIPLLRHQVILAISEECNPIIICNPLKQYYEALY